MKETFTEHNILPNPEFGGKGGMNISENNVEANCPNADFSGYMKSK